MSRSRLVSCIVVLAGAAAVASAAPPRPLPEFELVSIEGQAEAGSRDTSMARELAASRGTFTSTAPAASLVRAGRWLLLYVSPYSGASGPLLRALEGTTGPAGPTVVVVVAGAAEEAKAMAAGFEGRLGASWYADATGEAARALGLTGVPVVLGLRNDEIQWTLSGGVGDRRTLRSILVSWR